ncbi:Ig heavy chain V region 5-84 [Oryzias melastigma]|uniref:Ig heavy chain V region 5-84 n=1 Tax=Oryzias melastigma TaxID=30732 RepID=A0A834F426_ORYME|nr:Ig heavy chain V region 5-84 [Oryzias melastigma]
MFSAFITCVLLCLPYEADAVTFDPTFPIITQSEKKVEMKCRHNDSSLNVMLWYQQTRSGGMNLIGYGYTGSEPNLEKEFQSQFKMTREDVVRGGSAVKILQSGDLLSHAGAPLTLQCSMGVGFSMGSHTMFWYRQNHNGAQLEFLIKEYQETAGRFHSFIDTGQNNFSLHVGELLQSDSSTYFCAASHSDAPGPRSSTNTRQEAAAAELSNITSSLSCHRNSSSRLRLRSCCRRLALMEAEIRGELGGGPPHRREVFTLPGGLGLWGGRIPASWGGGGTLGPLPTEKRVYMQDFREKETFGGREDDSELHSEEQQRKQRKVEMMKIFLIQTLLILWSYSAGLNGGTFC